MHTTVMLELTNTHNMSVKKTEAEKSFQRPRNSCKDHTESLFYVASIVYNHLPPLVCQAHGQLAG
jgi:hypothetical protein